MRSIVGLLAVGALAAAACDSAEPFEAQLSLSPTSGPSGTRAEVVVDANDIDLTLELSDGIEVREGELDDTGRYDTVWEFVGDAGDVIELELVIFDSDGDVIEEDSASFTITEAPAGSEEPEDETAEEPEESEETTEGEDATAEDATAEETEEAEETAEEATAAVDVEVTVDPATGPAGENATITVKGAPNSPVTLTINGVGSTGGTTDADGNYTFETTFTGDDGDEIPVEAEVGVGADTRSGSATYTIDNPESACSVTAEDLVVTQNHDSGSLSQPLIDGGALSSIGLTTNACEFDADTYFVAITDVNLSGILDDGDTFTVAPQPAVGNGVDMGISQGGNHFIGRLPGSSLLPALEFEDEPLEGVTQNEDGAWLLTDGSVEVLIELVERGPDDPRPAFYNVDFGDPVMAPQP